MRRILVITLAAIPWLLSAGCSLEEAPTAPPESLSASEAGAIETELVAGEIVLAAAWGFDPEVDLPAGLAALRGKSGICHIREFDRDVLAGDIVHYGIVLSVGPGEHDVIGLHRVVRERRPYRPIRARKSLFVVHGAGKDFVGTVLPGLKSPVLPDDVGFGVFMAENDVDVWGIDLRYTLVPPGLQDLSFAADWGFSTSVTDIRAAVAIARLVRLFTGSGFGKMALMGYSMGSLMGYELLDRETQLPRGLRSVSAYIAADQGFVWDTEDKRLWHCDGLADWQALLDDGVYGFYDDPDGFFGDIGILARDHPDEPSPYFDGFTNLEVFLYFTAVPTPPFSNHFWAANFDEEEIPVSFRFTTLPMAADFWIYWAPMSPPTLLWRDTYAILCGEGATGWLDRVGDIEVPVLSLEAGGGFGPEMTSTLDFLTSADVTRHVVQFLPPDEAARDFGHVDLFTAENAMVEAWQPALAWLQSLRGREETAIPEVAEVLPASVVAELNALHPFGAASSGFVGATVVGWAPETASLAGGQRPHPSSRGLGAGVPGAR